MSYKINRELKMEVQSCKVSASSTEKRVFGELRNVKQHQNRMDAAEAFFDGVFVFKKSATMPSASDNAAGLRRNGAQQKLPKQSSFSVEELSLTLREPESSGKFNQHLIDGFDSMESCSDENYKIEDWPIWAEMDTGGWKFEASEVCNTSFGLQDDDSNDSFFNDTQPNLEDLDSMPSDCDSFPLFDSYLEVGLDLDDNFKVDLPEMSNIDFDDDASF